jgi:hypothetical protein
MTLIVVNYSVERVFALYCFTDCDNLVLARFTVTLQLLLDLDFRFYCYTPVQTYVLNNLKGRFSSGLG